MWRSCVDDSGVASPASQVMDIAEVSPQFGQPTYSSLLKGTKVSIAVRTGTLSWYVGQPKSPLVVDLIRLDDIANSSTAKVQTLKVGDLSPVKASAGDLLSIAYMHPQVSQHGLLSLPHMVSSFDRDAEVEEEEIIEGSVTTAVDSRSSIATTSVDDEDAVTNVFPLLGLAVAFDVLVLAFVMLGRKILLERNASGMPVMQYSFPQVIRPTFVRVPAPLCQDAAVFPEPCSPNKSEDGLMAQINSIVRARAEHREQSQKPSALQAQINSIVSAHAETREQSKKPPASFCPDEVLKSHINAIVGSHAERRKEAEEYTFQLHASNALAAADERRGQRRPSGPSPALPDIAQLPSPSPAKLSDIDVSYCAQLALSAAKERSTPAKSPLSNIEVAYHAHLALSAAKERDTPAKSPPTSFAHWEAYHEEDVAPCQLKFGDDDAEEAQKNEPQLNAVGAEDEPYAHLQISTVSLSGEPSDSTSCAATTGVEPVATKKSETSLNLSEIPSPTRNRAKRQQMLASTEAKSEEPWPSWEQVEGGIEASGQEVSSNKQRVKHRDFASPLHGGAVYRMLQNSATPQKQVPLGAKGHKSGRRSLPTDMADREQDVATRRAAAFEAWGVPTSAQQPACFQYQ